MQWVVVLFIIVVAVISAIAQTVKNQQEKAPPPRRRTPNRPAPARDGSSNPSSDMDRFLQEIEKLRKRSAEGGDEPRKQPKPVKTNKTVPTVAPVKRPRRQESIPKVAPSKRIEELPTATVLPVPSQPSQPAFPTAAPSPITDGMQQSGDAPSVSRAPKPVGSTPFGKNLLAMLGNKQSLPLAFVMQEVLGPPKCKQGPPST